MVRNIKTKWEWIADTIDVIIRDSIDRVGLKRLALEIEKLMALSYPFAPTNPRWEEAYSQLITDDRAELIDRFMYVCNSGCDSCSACYILEGVDSVEFKGENPEEIYEMRACELCRYGKLGGICEDRDSLYQFFQRNLRRIERNQSDLFRAYDHRWIPTFNNEEEDEVYGNTY